MKLSEEKRLSYYCPIKKKNQWSYSHKQVKQALAKELLVQSKLSDTVEIYIEIDTIFFFMKGIKKNSIKFKTPGNSLKC